MLSKDRSKWNNQSQTRPPFDSPSKMTGSSQIPILTCPLLQVKFAFLAGVGVVLLLIPLNRWLATKIEAASTAMMGCKDARIKRMAELLRGVRQIKAAGWEPTFVRRVGTAPLPVSLAAGSKRKPG